MRSWIVCASQLPRTTSRCERVPVRIRTLPAGHAESRGAPRGSRGRGRWFCLTEPGKSTEYSRMYRRCVSPNERPCAGRAAPHRSTQGTSICRVFKAAIAAAGLRSMAVMGIVAGNGCRFCPQPPEPCREVSSAPRHLHLDSLSGHAGRGRRGRIRNQF